MSVGIGEPLRAAREARGLTVEEAARAAQVASRYFRALEDEDFSVFPGDVYARGFLRDYAELLELDADALVERYGSRVQGARRSAASQIVEPVARPPRSGVPAWIAWTSVFVVVLAGAAAIGAVFQSREPVAAEPFVPPRTVAETVVEPAPSETPSAPEETPTPDGVLVALLFEEDSWIRVGADGASLEEGIVRSGETRRYKAEQRVEIRYGNPGGVRVELGGEDLGFAGDRGRPVTVAYTAGGAAPAE